MLTLNQIVNVSGSGSIASIMIPPFRAHTRKIGSFLRLHELLSKHFTSYLMDFSYMSNNQSHIFSNTNPDYDIQQIKELFEFASKRHEKTYCVTMCYGGALSIIAGDGLLDKLVVHSMIDLQNFYRFLIRKSMTNEPVQTIPEQDPLIVSTKRAQWFENRHTPNLIRGIHYPAFFIGNELDPYMDNHVSAEFKEAILGNTNCLLHTYNTQNHRLGINEEDAFKRTINFFLK